MHLQWRLNHIIGNEYGFQGSLLTGKIIMIDGRRYFDGDNFEVCASPDRFVSQSRDNFPRAQQFVPHIFTPAKRRCCYSPDPSLDGHHKSVSAWIEQEGLFSATVYRAE